MSPLFEHQSSAC